MTSANPGYFSLSPEIILERVSAIALQIQQCSPLEDILQGTIEDARLRLQIDRVLIYRFIKDEEAVLAFESVDRDSTPLLGRSPLGHSPIGEQPIGEQPIDEFGLPKIWLDQYRAGQIKPVFQICAEALGAANLPTSLCNPLERLQVQANLAAPISSQGNLWGLLVAHYCRSSREWQPIEMQYWQQIALHLGIAVQQAELQQSQHQLAAELEDCRQQMHLALQNSENRLSLALKAAKAGMWYWDAATNRTFWSEENYRLLGYDPQIHTPSYEAWLNAVHPEDREAVHRQITYDLDYQTPSTQTPSPTEQKRNPSLEYRVLLPNHEVRWSADLGEILYDAQGNPTGTIGIHMDITERKQAELALQQLNQELELRVQQRTVALQQSETRLKLAIEASNVGVWDWDVVNDCLTWDDRLYELYCIQSADFGDTYAAWRTRVHPDDVCVADAAIQQALTGETAIRHEFRVVLPDGTLRYIESCAMAVHNSEGQPIRLIGIDLDISDRKRVEMQQLELHQQIQTLNAQLELQVQERTAQLQQSLHFEELLKRITDRVRDSLDEQEILQAAVEELAAGLQVETCDTGIYSADQTTSTIAYEWTNLPSQALGKTFAIAEAPHFRVYDALFQGQICQFCDIVPGNLRPEQMGRTILACPIFDENCVLGDIWLFKASQNLFNELEVRLVQQVANQCAIALRQSRLFRAAQLQVQELERLNRLKDDFLSTVSHELRTPMSNIRMATQMLEISLKDLGTLDDPSHAIIHRYFNVLKAEGQREISLINDLLDLARLDAETEPLQFTPIEFQLYVPHLVESFIERTRQQQQQFVIQIPPDLPLFSTDLAYLERILSELLNNACKYTPSGETIALSAQATPEHLEICVTNSGTEIPPAERDRIFDKFYRIPSNDPWKHGGTGLGLALVKKLVQRLGGRIRLESEAGQTCFILRFER